MVCIKKGICGIFKKLEVISGSQIGVGWLETLSALCVPVTLFIGSLIQFFLFFFFAIWEGYCIFFLGILFMHVLMLTCCAHSDPLYLHNFYL